MDNDCLVALHNTNMFYKKDMRRDFELTDRNSAEYFVDYHVKYEMDRLRGNKVPCKKNYNFDTECVYNRLDAIKEHTKSNCTVPWAKNNSSICTDENDARKALNKALTIMLPPGLSKCPRWCQSMPIKISGGHGRGNLSSSITFNFQAIVPTSTEKYLYLFSNLFAEVGGYVGIMVGYSLVTLTDTLYDLLKTK